MTECVTEKNCSVMKNKNDNLKKYMQYHFHIHHKWYMKCYKAFICHIKNKDKIIVIMVNTKVICKF